MYCKEIIVIGGGNAGSTTTSLLSKVLEGLPINLTLVEQSKIGIFSQTGIMPARQHFGGEYPLDPETALQCLHGAMVLKQMFPSSIYTNEAPTRFLISRTSQLQGELTQQQYLNSYSNIQKKYGEHLEAISDICGDLFWGTPQSLLQNMSPKELEQYTKSEYFAGGFNSKEIGFSPSHWGVLTEQLLKRSNVKLSLGTTVIGAEKSDDGFDLKVRKLSEETKLRADYVVNSAWTESFKLERGIDVTEGSLASVFLRGIIILDISQIPEEQKPRGGFFCFLGESGGMYSPFNENIAFLSYPSNECTYIAQCEITDRNRSIPESWADWIKHGCPDQEQRMKTGFAVQCERFPWLKYAKPIGFLVRPTISFNGDDLTKRHHQTVVEVTTNWYRNIPAKATYVGIAAIETVQKILHALVRDNVLSLEEANRRLGFDINTSTHEWPILLPQQLCLIPKFTAKILSSRVKAAEFAAARGLPFAIANTGHLKIETHYPTPYLLNVTEATSGRLLFGGFKSTMTLRQAMTHKELQNYPDSWKFGFFSPIDTEGNAIAGEGTMIEGVCYWTQCNEGVPSIKIMPLDTPVTFAQIMVKRPEQQVSCADDKFDSFKSLANLIGNSVHDIKRTPTDSSFSDTNMNMMMACCRIRLTGKVRIATEPQPADATIVGTKQYRSIVGKAQYIKDINEQDVYIMFTNFAERIIAETDVKSPHVHIVPAEIIEKVRQLQQVGGALEENLAQINVELDRIVKQNNIFVGGHVVAINSGKINEAIGYQPIYGCRMIFAEAGRDDILVPLTDDRQYLRQDLQQAIQARS